MIPAFPGREALVNATIGPEQQPLTNRRLGRLVFIFRFWRFGRGDRSGLNHKRGAMGMNFFRKVFPEIFPAVVRNEQRETEEVNALIVRRIDANLAEVKWPRIHRTDACPSFTAILERKAPAPFAAQIA